MPRQALDTPVTRQEEIRPVLSHDIFAVQGVGGISRYVAELHKALRRLSVPSTVLAPLHQSDLLANLDRVAGVRIPAQLRVRGASRVAYWTGHLAEPPILALLSRRHRSLVLHRTYYSRKAPPRDMAAVITVHDMVHELHKDAFTPHDQTTIRKRIWCDQADMIIAVSHHTKAQLVALLGIDAARIVVCHHGVSSVDPNPRALETLGAQQAFLLYVGRRGGYKNFERLATAYARSLAPTEGVRLVAFGGEAPSTFEYAHLERLGITYHVSFTRGDDAELAAYYAAAVGLIYPSLDEGFGFPPLEAMLHGCPVAASGAGAIPEVVDDAALLFDPTSVEDMSNAINRIASDTALRAILASRGIARATTFTWEDAAKGTLSAYDFALEHAEARL
jgi:glycosyltransferase involved in cell wall biosynthesis